MGKELVYRWNVLYMQVVLELDRATSMKLSQVVA